MAGALLLLGAIAIYGAWVEPSRLILREVHIRRGGLARVLSGRRAAVLGDLHLGPGEDPLAERALAMLERSRPDMILLAGDLVAWGGGPDAYEKALAFLSRLEAPLGVYAVLGDADRTSTRHSCVLCHEAGSGIPTTRHRAAVLRNSAVALGLPQGRLRIVGLAPGFPPTATTQLADLLQGPDPVILLSHSSAVYAGIDGSREVLTVAGDTHGGQVLVPAWLWRLVGRPPDPLHRHGWFAEGAKTLLVTSGVGTSRVRFRLGVTPEIVLLHFSGGNP